jgi:hypothetical protein
MGIAVRDSRCRCSSGYLLIFLLRSSSAAAVQGYPIAEGIGPGSSVLPSVALGGYVA